MTRRAAAACLAVLFAVVGTSCNRTIGGSGHVVSRPYPVAPFEHVVVSGPFDVRLAEAPATRVILRVDDNLADDVSVESSQNTLHVQLKPNVGVRHATLQVEVQGPVISTIDASDAATARVQGDLTGGRISLSATGASHLDGRVDAEHLALTVADASSVTIAGRAGELRVDGQDAAHIDAAGLEAADLDLHLADASSASVWCTGTMKADVSDASHGTYKGSPTFESRSVSDASSLSPA
jgi:Putative auto-transporter adhesin, head GIN domain